MKKFTVILSALLLIPLVSCTKDVGVIGGADGVTGIIVTEKSGNDTDSNVTVDVGENDGLNVVNPYTSITLEELRDTDGIDVTLPEDAHGIYVARISTDITMYEVEFISNEKDYTLRFVESEENGDISGMYYTFSEPETVIVNGIDVSMRFADTLGVCNYRSGVFNVSLTSLNSVTKSDFEAVINSISINKNRGC